MIRANDDSEIGWDEAQWLVSNGKSKARALCYQGPVNTCAAPGCGVPTSGVFCLSCATK